MRKCFYPRISEAKDFLPLLRSHLIAAAPRHSLPVGLSVDLLPIVEDGLFGYELVPGRKTHTYLTIGCNAQGDPVVRKTVYGVDGGRVLRLVAIDGRVLSRTQREVAHEVRRDTGFSEWTTAAEAALAQLSRLFPQRPRQPMSLHEHAHRSLDEALSVTYSHLAQWDPFIHFCGLANEAQIGFALVGSSGGHGELVFQRPDIWILRWKVPPQAVYESWSVAPDVCGDSAQGDLVS